jgi:hypothetical protein
MKYTVIEDCSPYYIRFTYEGIDEFINYSLNVYKQQDWSHIVSRHPGFRVCKLSEDLGREVILKTPMSKQMPLIERRVSFFTSAPGLVFPAHKDGDNNRFSINYALKVLDDKCVTSWYGDELADLYQMDQSLFERRVSRECLNFDKTKHVPIKTLVATQGECVLFNTEIYHDFDNSNSTNERILLTFRSTTPKDIYFDDARRILGV